MYGASPGTSSMEGFRLWKYATASAEKSIESQIPATYILSLTAGEDAMVVHPFLYNSLYQCSLHTQ